ncbi:MAG: hypothetical protein ABI068_17210, partial [Ktedonobacterales bacterium]
MSSRASGARVARAKASPAAPASLSLHQRLFALIAQLPPWERQVAVVAVSLVVGAVAIWLAARPELPKPHAPASASLVLGSIAITTGSLILWLRQRSGLEDPNKRLL